MAIDLGTTNSVLAYGNLGKNGIKPKKTMAVEIDRMNEEGGSERRKPHQYFIKKIRRYLYL